MQATANAFHLHRARWANGSSKWNHLFSLFSFIVLYLICIWNLFIYSFMDAQLRHGMTSVSTFGWAIHRSIHRTIHLDIECMIYVSSFIFLFSIKHHLLDPLFPTNYHHKQQVDGSLRVGLPKQVEHRFVIGHLANHNTWYYHMKLSLHLFYECTIFGLQIEYFFKLSFPFGVIVYHKS